jgi:hypothetical protein
MDKEVSITAEADWPFVAERPMYFDYTGSGSSWTGGHDTVGATVTSGTWYFAEGYTGAGFDEWVCVLNPGDDPALLTFNFQIQEEGTERIVDGLSVDPHSRHTFKVNDLLGGAYQSSLKLVSNQPVVAERSMYFDYGGTGGWGWTGGHCVMGTPILFTSYYFAEGTTRPGFEEWLTIQNPGTEEIAISAVYLLGTGSPVTKDYAIPPKSRTTLYVPTEVGQDKDVSVYLESSSLFLAERPMYFNYQGTRGWNWTGGHCVIGATSPATQWFLAEGYTGHGFEEWICILNDNPSEVTVNITYYPEGGAKEIRKEHKVAPNSRYTVPVNTDAGADVAASAVIRSSERVVVERPMYFDKNGWTGGHDVVGYTL